MSCQKYLSVLVSYVIINLTLLEHLEDKTSFTTDVMRAKCWDSPKVTQRAKRLSTLSTLLLNSPASGPVYTAKKMFLSQQLYHS